MAAAVGLTDAKVKGLKAPASGQVEHADKLVAGLRVRVGSSGAKTFILRKRIGGKVRNISLGRFNEQRFTLADARKRARLLLNDIEARGAPPIASLARHQDGTVRELWEQYVAQAVRGRKRSASEIERIGRTQILPILGDRLADSVTRGDVTAMVEAVTFRNPNKPTPRAGRSAHQQLSAFYSWALPKLDRLPGNPCRDAGRPALAPPRDRVLSEAEIRQFWNACETLGWPFGHGFQLLLLTAQRRGEVFGARWSEFDLEGKVWTVPAVRAKNAKEHTVPLSAPVLRILEVLPRFEGTDLLFPARGRTETHSSGISKAVKRLRNAMGEPAHFTLHDARRTAATGMQRLGIKLEVVEAILNHVSGSRAGIVGVYQRHQFLDEKAQALDAWAAEVERIVRGEGRGNVINLRTGA